MSLLAAEERSPCDNQMAGCEAEPTPERPAGGACDRQFVAAYGPTRMPAGGPVQSSVPRV